MESGLATSDDVISNLGIAGTLFCYDLWFVWVFPLLGSDNHEINFYLTPCLTP